MVNNKEAPTKLKEDQSLVVLVAQEKPRYGIRKADWDRIKKNIKKSIETYGELTFLQKFQWVLITSFLSLISPTVSSFVTLGPNSRLFIVYSALTLCFFGFAIVFYLFGKKVREYKTDRLKEILEDMDELEKSLEKKPETSFEEYEMRLDGIINYLKADQQRRHK